MLGGPQAALRACLLTLGLATAFLLLPAAGARADDCPPIKDKPGTIPHVDYEGVQHLTYCDGPIDVHPGQNLIRINGTDLFPQEPGYITRFDPELVYPNGKVPRVDILHLHHAVWIINGNPQFAVGEEKTIVQLPEGFGWRSKPSDNWLVNDMLHDLTASGGKVDIVWRIDFVPDTSPAAATMKTAHTQWLDVSGPTPRQGISSPIYPVFDSLRKWGTDGKYTFPDDAVGKQTSLVGPSQTWTPNHPVTLLGSTGHLHPGGLYTDLDVTRGDKTKRLFRSKAKYYEPAGAVSWDVAMKATPPDWRVQLQPGDELSVHATYDTSRADWYEVMGIMPVAVYNGANVGGVDAFGAKLPRKGVVTHGHLAENRHHGGGPAGLPNPLGLPDGPISAATPVEIENYLYSQGDLHTSARDRRPATVPRGQSITFDNLDDADDTYHTITACKAPCNRDTGVAYPIANGSRTFDSGQLGHNSTPFGGPAVDRNTWTTPTGLKPGTYSFFCRVHPFMRGSFRVIKRD